MNIYLFLKDKLVSFSLPQEKSGSFSFDENPNEETKLINVEARNGEWVLYSTSDVQVINANSIIASASLIDNNFYILKRNDINYLIYVSVHFNNKITLYSYDQTINLTIGNTSEFNIQYPCPLLNQISIKIHNMNGALVLDSNKPICYVNNKIINPNNYQIKNGDHIYIYGLKLIFLNNVLLLNNPGGTLQIKQDSNLKIFNIPQDEQPKDILIKDNELYSKNDYFSKSPRIRRSFSTKEIEFSKPPKKEKDEELPVILTVGPMLTMGATSVIMLANTLDRINRGTTTFRDSWATVASAVVMLISMLLWPILTKRFNQKKKLQKNQEVDLKYSAYLADKRKELDSEQKLQKEILEENLLTTLNCLEIIKSKNMNFWNKRLDENDLLTARIGIGNEYLDVNINYPKEGFEIDEDVLKRKADELVEEFKYIHSVPLGYSFYTNKLTAIMGENKNKNIDFLNNILIQFLTYYSYEDLKIVVFTNESNYTNWEYLKYTNHCFDNERKFRFFSSTKETANKISEYLTEEIKKRNEEENNNEKKIYRPYYLIIVDDYERIKEYEFVNMIAENDKNLGFSMIIVEQRLSKLPSKCNNYIDIQSSGKSGILKNNFDKQDYILFTDEICPNINYMDISRIISNIPIEFEEKVGSLPDAISFLEMEKVGKVEQLNILNRWNTNDSTTSLKAEIGVDEKNELMYLDLHEKYHGPHGLIAGTTGSGKSEFIITYILSMCINYSPNDIAFILIDYKGGGLALAFENKLTGITLPHLAGTITNLDKAEMDRTLVSIDSEVKRRQQLFNEARDKLGESTIDIYKYQRHFKAGRIEEPIPHLFIICDEFAELKSQQPEFMDNLISVARIGRSLGVHLILATQKPSGVVNDQIWSNTKFRVCLKVANEADSNEMLKHPDAAYLTKSGRYYLQVGYDEIYALGQSGWGGAKYYPSDKIVKQIDKSINYINDCAEIIRSAEETNDIKIEAQGEQLAAIMKNIIEISDATNIKAKKLWLDNIPSIILADEVIKRYNIIPEQYNVEGVIGEYDAPEKQEQGILKYNYMENGNAIIYSNDNSDSEMFFNALIYTTVKMHTSEEINFYMIDYGSESFRKYMSLPHVGGVVFAEENEKYNNLIKMIREEIVNRKKLFMDYGGSYTNYIKNSGQKVPLKVFILNNYDAFYEGHEDAYDTIPELTRDSVRYGIIFLISCLASSSIRTKVTQNFDTLYTYKLKDPSEYGFILGGKKKIVPRDIVGRGVLNNDGLHEFQTVSITENPEQYNEFMTMFINAVKQRDKTFATRIPTLPEIVRIKDVNHEISTLSSVPIGIKKSDIDIYNYDFVTNFASVISSKKIANINVFLLSLIQVFKTIPKCNIFIFDILKKLTIDTMEYPNYYSENYTEVIEKLTSYIDKLIEENSEECGILIIYGISSITNEIEEDILSDFLKKLKSYGKISIIGIDESGKMGDLAYESWYKKTFTSSPPGIWVGKGCGDQNILKVDDFNRTLQAPYKNDMGFVIIDGEACLIKLIDFITTDEEKKDEK